MSKTSFETGWLAAMCFCLLVLGISAVTLAFPGTPDVSDFLRWSAALTKDDVFYGYSAVADYPPLGPFLIWAATSAGRFCHVPAFAALKLSIDCFQFFSALIIWHRLRSWPAASLFFLLISPFGSLLGYIDVFYLPFILLGIFALERDQLTMATSMFTIATLIKWQPAILCPVVAIYVIGRIAVLPTMAHRLIWPLPALFVSVIVISAFGPHAIWAAFSGATSDPLFSGQAFNLDWILTYVIEIFHIANKHFSATGTIEFVNFLPLPWYMLSRCLFWFLFFINLAVFGLHRTTFGTLLLCLICAESIQFTFNTGVHENHAFLVMILAFVACVAGVLPKFYLTLTASLAIANILSFYGIAAVTGRAASAGTVLLSTLQLVICLTLISRLVAACRHSGRISFSLRHWRLT